MRPLVLAALIATTAAGYGWTSPRAAAQTAGTATPYPGDPADCQIAPRPANDFTALREEPPPATPDLPPNPFQGEPADPATVAAVTETVHEFFACFNAGDFGRIAALYTDEGFHRNFSGPGADVTAEDLADLLRPRPTPPEQWRILEGIDDVRMLPDGRATTIVDAAGQRSLLVLAPGGDRYLIDGAYPLPAAPAPAATPQRSG
ncbi:MAG: hypothetical protein IT337_08855 [Thermomicrobiales bacterium]|nr:hypothetical protein [Thermomicrobiales bacterium]